ncbi:MAG: helix-turn-helix domain-containing protein [Candidatus Pacebacteria bacterium]|nr:helix-turn-helix domain-containing protein [Candidatus Paceibacterota bacterium]
MLNKQLEKIGLNPKEADVYLACLELTEATVGEIAKKSGVKRTTVYDIIDSLKEKSLVSSITKNKKLYYYAESPKKLENTLEEKKKILENMMPELMSVANAIDKKPKIRYFEGIEGMRDVFRDTLNYPDQEILSWFPKKTGMDLGENFFYKEYIPKRMKKKIWVRAIAPETEEMKKYKENDDKHLRQTRLISPDKFNSEINIELYGGEKVMIVGFEEEIGIMIESKKIYTALKSMFEIMWSGL